MLRVRLTKGAIFIHSVLPLLVGAFMTWTPLFEPIFASESNAYIKFSELYPLGYPLLLRLLDLFASGPEAVIYVQIWTFAFSIFYLSLSIRKNTDSHFLGLIIGLCILLNPWLWSVHYTILPHSLFVSFSLLALGFFISGFGRAWFLNLFGFGLSIGLCIILEPFGWAYLVLIFAASPLLVRRNHCSLAKAFLLPLVITVALIGLERTTHSALHPVQPDQPHAPHVFVSAILMESEQESPYAQKDPRTLIWQMIETDLKTTRNEIWQTEDFADRILKLRVEEDRLFESFAIRELNGAAALLIKTPNDIRMDIASSRIVQDPLAFFFITFDHYRGLWQSNNLLGYILGIITGLCVLSGLWALFTRARFNAMFAAAFMSSLAVQAQTIWIAHSGLGPDHIVGLLSPLLTLACASVLLGFYIAFISPLRNDA